MKDNKDFEYKYSAPTANERKEIEGILNSYLPMSEPTAKLTRLRKLDNTVRNLPTSISLIIGIIASLIFGTGLTMILEWNIILWGIIVSVIGVITMLLTYPVFITITKKLKNNYREEILQISDELLNNEKK